MFRDTDGLMLEYMILAQKLQIIHKMSEFIM